MKYEFWMPKFYSVLWVVGCFYWFLLESKFDLSKFLIYRYTLNNKYVYGFSRNAGKIPVSCVRDDLILAINFNAMG